MVQAYNLGRQPSFATFVVLSRAYAAYVYSLIYGYSNINTNGQWRQKQ